ncbi:hypothetical protein FACS1894199_19490 [Bacteroidia bacterium]|nr:hypothetical protein FACS1894199_19490 [Bacteroidia bacterium]
MKRIAFFVLGALLLGSCSDMGDSLKDFVTEETIYPAKFDKADAYTGYENVVIDLLNNVGRDVPASQIHLARATKTVVEYGDGPPLVIDSVCSSVKITGLTQPAIYKFIIYTMDDDKNKSLPVEVSRAPFTAADKELLLIPAPVIEHLGGDVKVEWQQNITSILLTYRDRLIYSYTPVGSGTAVRDTISTASRPSFIVTNIAVGATLHIQYRVKPKVSNVEILDEIWLERPLVIPAP